MKSSCASSAAKKTATPPCSLAASATRRAWNTSGDCLERACSRGSAEQETSNARAESRNNLIHLLSRHAARRAKQITRVDTTLAATERALVTCQMLTRVMAGRFIGDCSVERAGLGADRCAANSTRKIAGPRLAGPGLI